MTAGDPGLRLVADTLLELPYEAWNFGDSVAFEAMVVASDTLGDPRWGSFARGFGRAWAARAAPYRRLDCTAPGAALAGLAARCGDDLLLRALVGLADYLLGRPTLQGVFETWEHSPLVEPYGPTELTAHERGLLDNPPPGVFVDCLHFDPPFLAALASATAVDEYLSAALDQALGYVRLLQTASGLFDHFILRGEPGTFGPGWGRGQGWALLGLLDVIEQASSSPAPTASDDRLRRVSEATARLASAMVRTQRADGHWFAVVTEPASGDEFSTAAFMASGLRRAARLGLGDVESLSRSASAALRATREGLDDAGTLSHVSAAVMACTEASHYAHVPTGFRVPWGQGPAVLALAGADDRAAT